MVARYQLAAAVIVVLVSAASGQVWVSTFDSTADGVVDVFDNNPAKAMIGAASGGFLQVILSDSTGGDTIDKAGRPLDAAKTGAQSFSALYKFRWALLNEQTVDAYEMAGFIGSTGTPPPSNFIKQFCGAVLRHRKAPSDVSQDYYVNLGLGFGSTGGNFGYLPGPDINLGSGAVGATYHLAICYNGFSKQLTLRLTDSAGNRLGSLIANLTTDVPALKTGGNPLAEVNALSVTHLGWSDYAGTGGDRLTIWEVDSLAYYGNAAGACNALPAEPTGACCDPLAGTCSNGTYAACLNTQCVSPTSGCPFLNRNFRGAGTSCASITCPQPPTGACCNPDGSCTEPLTQLNCTNAGGTWQGDGSTCGQVSCPQPAPRGACCLIAAGTCTDNMTEADCTAAGATTGIWQGPNTQCGQTTCPAPAPGACCAIDGTCSITTMAACTEHWAGPGSDCSAPATCVADAPLGYVWLSTFDQNTDHVETITDCHEPYGIYNETCWDGNDGDNDGAVDCQDGDCQNTKFILGSVHDGRLDVVVADNQTPTPYVPDKAGRLIGASPISDAKRWTDSFSSLYQFSWSQLYGAGGTGDPGAVEFPAFIGALWSDADPRLPTAQSRQVLGALLRHWRDSFGNYWVDIGLVYGGVGAAPQTVAFQNQATYEGSFTNLGPYAVNKYYQLAMGYDGPTKRFTIKLYDSKNNLLGSNSGVLTSFYSANANDEVGAMRMTHVGWLDYTGSRADNQDTTWQVDRLAFFDDSYGAFREPLSPGACCQPSGACLDNQSLAACAALGSKWQGPATACAQVQCPLPPCNTPFADADGDKDVDMDDFGPFQVCLTGAGQPIRDKAACHCFDRDGNGSIDLTDFALFTACASGASVPANAGCGTP